jgi:hypothetical protein
VSWTSTSPPATDEAASATARSYEPGTRTTWASLLRAFVGHEDARENAEQGRHPGERSAVVAVGGRDQTEVPASGDVSHLLEPRQR